MKFSVLCYLQFQQSPKQYTDQSCNLIIWLSSWREAIGEISDSKLLNHVPWWFEKSEMTGRHGGYIYLIAVREYGKSLKSTVTDRIAQHDERLLCLQGNIRNDVKVFTIFFASVRNDVKLLHGAKMPMRAKWLERTCQKANGCHDRKLALLSDAASKTRETKIACIRSSMSHEWQEQWSIR